MIKSGFFPFLASFFVEEITKGRQRTKKEVQQMAKVEGNGAIVCTGIHAMIWSIVVVLDYIIDCLHEVLERMWL